MKLTASAPLYFVATVADGFPIVCFLTTEGLYKGSLTSPPKDLLLLPKIEAEDLAKIEQEKRQFVNPVFSSLYGQPT